MQSKQLGPLDDTYESDMHTQHTVHKQLAAYLLHTLIKEGIGRVLRVCEGPVLNERTKQLQEACCREVMERGEGREGGR